MFVCAHIPCIPHRMAAQHLPIGLNLTPHSFKRKKSISDNQSARAIYKEHPAATCLCHVFAPHCRRRGIISQGKLRERWRIGKSQPILQDSWQTPSSGWCLRRCTSLPKRSRNHTHSTQLPACCQDRHSACCPWPRSDKGLRAKQELPCAFLCVLRASPAKALAKDSRAAWISVEFVGVSCFIQAQARTI